MDALVPDAGAGSHGLPRPIADAAFDDVLQDPFAAGDVLHQHHVVAAAHTAEVERQLGVNAAVAQENMDLRADLEEKNAALTAANKRMREALASKIREENAGSSPCVIEYEVERELKALSPESEKPAPEVT